MTPSRRISLILPLLPLVLFGLAETLPFFFPPSLPPLPIPHIGSSSVAGTTSVGLISSQEIRYNNARWREVSWAFTYSYYPPSPQGVTVTNGWGERGELKEKGEE